MLIGQGITIVGAGIGGLAAALALAQRGAQVTVLEQAAQIREVGAGIQISPNGFRVLHALGLGGDVRQSGLISQAVHLRDYRRGASVLRMDIKRYANGAAPFVLIHRAQMIDLLARAAQAAGVTLSLGHRATPDDEPLPGETLRIHADGLHSEMRNRLNQSETPFFTGQVAWRAILPDPGATPEAQVFMGPGRHLVSYPIDGERRNIVAVEERTEWADEGWHHADDPAHLRAAFAGFAPVVRGWLDAVDTVHLWGLHRHPVAQCWQDGKSAILGDAAHPTLPFLAQGANLALEDAWVLAASLAEHGMPEGLALYEAQRRPRATRVIAAANANARNFHLSNPLIRQAAHTVLRLGSRLRPNAALGRFAWLYEHNATAQ